MNYLVEKDILAVGRQVDPGLLLMQGLPCLKNSENLVFVRLLFTTSY